MFFKKRCSGIQNTSFLKLSFAFEKLVGFICQINIKNEQKPYMLRYKGIFRRIFKTSKLKTLKNALGIVKYVSYPFQTILNLNKAYQNGCLFPYSHQADVKQLCSLLALIRMFNAIFYFSCF